ncbi:MAG: prevent-host-death protein [Thioploca sp.]|nr:prevent-host-death protein [Thioploca sp.]
MIIYTYDEAQQNFSRLLEQATREEVFVTNTQGLLFAIVPKSLKKLSHFAVKGIKTSATTADILEALRESKQANLTE